MSSSVDLTPIAQDGFSSERCEGEQALAACPYMESSPAAMAWLVGAWLRATGQPAPRAVRMSRGYKVHANGMLLSLADPAAIARIE
ncbi:hypothetical protein EJP67_33320 [Variovorax guangxiensis]|uniref:Uncharacterized protein n=1 Tax=Variovorax guangxiensis TaxID=1775474 RepID=A0A3S0ZFL8_9BURK|nr:hypothetical protein [Variovorax guangxiensis]RUR71939.1 hypothetical protein EJP67_33320 [Variovorax guangxiensis]